MLRKIKQKRIGCCVQKDGCHAHLRMLYVLNQTDMRMRVCVDEGDGVG